MFAFQYQLLYYRGSSFPNDKPMTKESSPKKPLWNSLEVAKIGVGILTPLAIFFFTYQTNKLQTREAEGRAEQIRQETEERERFVQVTKQRIELWSAISPLMNDLYCYFLYVGHWKELAPEQVVSTKRKLDKLIYSNSPFFSSEFLAKYNAFMSATFKTGNAWNVDAQLKSPPIRDKDRGKEWMFARTEAGYIENTSEIYNTYFDWLTYAGKEMDLEVKPPPKPQTPNASEIRDRLERKP